MTEEVVVEATPFAPAQYGTGLGTGLSSSGEMVTTTTSVMLPSSYAVVLRCEAHGRFAVQGSDERYWRMWNRFNVGQRLTVTYREKRNRAGELVGLDFISAEPISPPTP